MFFSILFLTFIATPFVHLTVADILLGDTDNTNLFLDSDNHQLSSDDVSPLWDTDISIGDADTDSTFLIDSSLFALNNDQTNSIELAELGDLCEAPPSKRSRREVCIPSDRQGQDQSIVNQLTFPNLFDVFKPKKKAPAREPLGDPPFGDSPTGQNGNPCPAERPLHLCCLASDTRWSEIEGLYINYFTLSMCSPAFQWGQCYEQDEYEVCCTSYLPGSYIPNDGRRSGFSCIVIKYPTPVPPLEGPL